MIQDLPVVHGVEAEVGVGDGRRNGVEHRLLVRLDGQRPRVGRGHIAHLVQGRQGAVVIHLDAVEHARVRLAGTDLPELNVEAVHRLLHVFFRRVVGEVDHFTHGSNGHDGAHFLSLHDAEEVAGLVDVEYDDGQLVLVAQGEGGHVHDLEAALEHLVEGQGC